MAEDGIEIQEFASQPLWMICTPLCSLLIRMPRRAGNAGAAAFGMLLVRIYLKSLGAKSANARRQDSHSWAVP